MGYGNADIEVDGDFARMTFHCQACMGVPDSDSVFEIRKGEIDGLPPPENLPDGDYTLESRYVDVRIPQGGESFDFCLS